MQWFLWANILIAGSAAAWVIIALRVLVLPFDWLLILLAFVLALGFYTRDRLDVQEHQTDQFTMPERTAWVKQHTKTLKGVVWATFLGAIMLITIRPAVLLPLAAGLGFALSYTLRWLPWRGGRVGWKHLPGIKMPFVAILWTLTTVIIPATAYNYLWYVDTWLLAGVVCTLIMIQILLNDLRDIEGDRTNGVESLPVLIGEEPARRVGYGLALIATILAIPVSPLLILLTALYSAFLLWRYQQENDAYWRVWIEGQGVVAIMIDWIIQIGIVHK